MQSLRSNRSVSLVSLVSPLRYCKDLHPSREHNSSVPQLRVVGMGKLYTTIADSMFMLNFVVMCGCSRASHLIFHAFLWRSWRYFCSWIILAGIWDTNPSIRPFMFFPPIHPDMLHARSVFVVCESSETAVSWAHISWLISCMFLHFLQMYNRQR